VIFPYLLRLFCLCLASFFVVHSILGLVVSRIAPYAVRVAERMTALSAARFLLCMRLLPVGAALFLVAGVCIPSYVSLEPEATAEQVGFAFLIATASGAWVWGVSIYRAIRACINSARYIRRCESAGRKTRMPGEASPVWMIEAPGSFLGLAGIIRPRVVISRDVFSVLTSEQLSAALRHEDAHRSSRDNLKRLFVLLAPDVFPFVNGFRGLERARARFAEWAADDRAVAGDSRRSLSLAAALVRVARIGAACRPSTLATCLVGDRQDLSARVNRLLHPARQVETDPRTPVLIGSAGVALAALLTTIMLRPGILLSGHELLERLIH
jgi:Zn-dependent protease with chaperone function